MNDRNVRELEPQSKSQTRSRDPLFAVILGFFALGNLYATYRNAEIYWDLVSHGDPNLPHLPFLIFAILGIVAVISIVGLWFWKKWAFYLYIAVQVIGAFLLFSLVEAYGLPKVLQTIFTSSIGPAIFVAYLYQKRYYLE